MAMTSSAADFDEQSATFLSWFLSQPGTTFHPSLRFADLRDRHAGRGIIALADIPANTDLFTIPRSAIVRVEGSRLAQKLPEIFNDSDIIADDESDLVDDIPKPWINLILVLIFESLHRDTSPWAPYLDILPKTPSEFDTLMFWTSTEIQQLQSSHVVSKIGRSAADDMFKKRVLPIVVQNADIFYPHTMSFRLTEDELLQMAHCIGSLIMSYAFDLQADVLSDDSSDGDGDAVDGWKEDTTHEGTMGMVPMADMLNADAEFNAHLSHGDDVLTMTSIRKIVVGEEILNYYGPLPNAELCRRYGYTSPKHHIYDVVELSWPLVKNCVMEEFSNEVGLTKTWLAQSINSLEEENDLNDETFVLERETEGPDNTGICPSPGAFQSLPEDYINLMLDILNGPKSKMAGEKEQKKHVMSIFLRILKTRLSQYDTTVVQDDFLASQATGRVKMAIEIRCGEKRLIEEAIIWAERKLQGLTERSSSGYQTICTSSPPMKRQKRGP